MHDIKAIRANPDHFTKGWTNRGLDGASLVAAILTADEQTRRVQTESQRLASERTNLSKEIGAVKGQGGDAGPLMAQVANIKTDMERLDVEFTDLSAQLNGYLVSLPNIMQDDVPVGPDEGANVEILKWGTPGTRNDNPDHVAIGEGLGLFDAARAAAISGARFTFLYGDLARLERALAQFMIDLHTRDHGLTEVSPPLMVRDDAVFGVGQLPKFEEDLFKTNTDHWLISTAEVSLTNLVADQIIDAESLPLRFTAHTPCFRSEAGSAGRDTRGMIRQHQFYKVEMVTIARPEDSVAEHERMVGCAESVLQALKLPYRKMVLCTGDAGFCSQKTYDLEVWLPGQAKYREISSVSNCGDFQARRMKARCRVKGDKETRFVHTLNGSGLAVGRTLVAVLENYYNPADGSVTVPDVLRPYMGGLDKIMPRTGNNALFKAG